MHGSPHQTEELLAGAYVKAMIGVFVMLLAADWIAFAICGKWLAWPVVAAVAIAWPIVMTAIT